MCVITSGHLRQCDSPGGVATVYAWNTEDVDTMVVVAGEVTAFDMKPGKYIYEFQVEMETAVFTDTAIGTRQAGSYGREQAGTVVLTGNTKEMIVQLELMGKGRTSWAAELNDETYEVFFRRNGSKTLDARSTGTAFEDLNGNTLTLAGKEPNKAPKISAALIAANLAPAS